MHFISQYSISSYWTWSRETKKKLQALVKNERCLLLCFFTLIRGVERAVDIVSNLLLRDAFISASACPSLGRSSSVIILLLISDANSH